MSNNGEPKSGFHKFIQYFNLPVGLFNLWGTLMLGLKVKPLLLGTDDEFIMYVSTAFIIAVTILNIVTQFGFAFYMGFSFYTIILYNITIVANNAVLTELMERAEVSQMYLITARSTLTGSLVMMIIVIIYYSTHRNLFIFNEREEKPKKEKKKKNDPWANTEKYVPEPVVKLSRKEEASIASRRLTGMLKDEPEKVTVSTEEPDIFDGLK